MFLVSALLSSHSDSATVQVIGKIFTGEIIPLFSAPILREYHEVLRRKKFHFSEEMVSGLLGTIEKYGIMIYPEAVAEVLLDEKDLPFYEVVMEKQEDSAYLVTGNMKHFPQKPFIVTAKQLLDIIGRK